MTDQHPITPPQDLIDHWSREAFFANAPYLGYVSAAQWGSDQELEACCEWAQGYAECGDSLRLARRHKPPSLKEQALDVLKHKRVTIAFNSEEHNIIRRALEALPND